MDQQLEFLSSFVKLYGFNGLNDYKSQIGIKDLDDEISHLKSVNEKMPEIIKLFKSSNLNLSRKKYKIDSINLSFSMLRKLLQQANVPFTMIHHNTGNKMRLVPVNFMLVNYINQTSVKDIDQESSQMSSIEVIKNDPPSKEISPQYRKLENIFKPNNQDKYLYENFGGFPLEGDVIKNILPPSTQMIQKSFSGNTNFGKRVSCLIDGSFPGQCISQLYLNIDLREEVSDGGLVDCIRMVDITIGNQQIQRYTGTFLKSWLSLSGIPLRIGNMVQLPISLNQYIPFPLHYLDPKKHPMKVEIEFNDIQDLTMKDSSIYVDFEFPNPSLKVNDDLPSIEYLMETVQFTGYETGLFNVNKIRINFNGPIKTLMWNFLEVDSKSNIRYPSNGNVMRYCKFQMNGEDFQMWMPSSYYKEFMQTKFGGSCDMYCYTFAKKPMWVRPTGTLNFSSINTICLVLDLDPSWIKSLENTDFSPAVEIYGISYNIIKIDQKLGAGMLLDL